MADWFSDTFEGLHEDRGDMGGQSAHNDPFWKSLFKGVSAGLKDVSGNGFMSRGQPIQELRTGSTPYQKQYDARSPKGPAVQDYDSFLSQWENRMYQFTRAARTVGAKSSD